MSGILIDTNVVSETARLKPDRRVLAFLETENDLWLPVIAVHELEFGIRLLPTGRRRDRIADAVRLLVAQNASRILPIDVVEAEHAASLRARAARSGRNLDLGDALIAATAAAHDLAIATRNTKDFQGLDLKTVNPWNHPQRF